MKSSTANKTDRMEIGNPEYEWSMYIPNDAMIYKSDRGNSFEMSTNSYQTDLELEVIKNAQNITVEEMFYKMQNTSKMPDADICKFEIKIANDNSGQKYISIVKSPETSPEFIENRMYVSNNYIYNLTLIVTSEFYKCNKEKFNEFASSFKTFYDKNNPNIKKLLPSSDISSSDYNPSPFDSYGHIDYRGETPLYPNLNQKKL